MKRQTQAQLDKARARAGNDAQCAIRKLHAWALAHDDAELAETLKAIGGDLAGAVETLRALDQGDDE